MLGIPRDADAQRSGRIRSPAALKQGHDVRPSINNWLRNNRHDAIHAIASVLTGIVFDAVRNPEGKPIDINDGYRELAELTAASWRAT